MPSSAAGQAEEARVEVVTAIGDSVLQLPADDVCLRHPDDGGADVENG